MTILCYHNFDLPKVTPFTVDTATFDKQLSYLASQHISVIPLSELAAYLQGKGTVPDHAAVITIDDGYKTARTKAWPILKKYKFRFTLFVYPQAISRHGDALTWADLKEMAAAGVDVESHSLTHPLLTHPGVAMNRPTYRAWVDHELRESKAILEKKLGKPITAIAYPYGGYDELIAQKTRDAGYDIALTCDDGNVTRVTDPMHLNRRLVYHKTPFKEFMQFFTERTLLVSEQAPKDGERINGVPKEITARVNDVSSIDVKTARIMVDKAGRIWQPVTIDPTTGQFHHPLPTLDKHGYFFVSLMAHDKANPAIWREASWLFIVRRKRI